MTISGGLCSRRSIILTRFLVHLAMLLIVLLRGKVFVAKFTAMQSSLTRRCAMSAVNRINVIYYATFLRIILYIPFMLVEIIFARKGLLAVFATTSTTTTAANYSASYFSANYKISAFKHDQFPIGH